MTGVPGRAGVVVIGGGVMGTSIAYHLARAGVPDVVLVERDELASGSTSRAAGGVRAQFSDELNIQLGARSLEAFARFGEEPGQDIGLHRVGYLFLLSTPEEVAAFEAGVRLQNALGVPSRMIDPAEAHRLSPLITTDGLLAAAFSPDDGHCTPESVVHGYAAGARRHGADRRCGTARSPASRLRGDEITAVRHRAGAGSTTDTVVCAAGAWSRAVGAMVGVDLPVEPLRRQIAVTEPVPDLPPDLPMTIDFTTQPLLPHRGPRPPRSACPTPTRPPASPPRPTTAGSPACARPWSAAPPPCSTCAGRAAGRACTRSRRTTTR